MEESPIKKTEEWIDKSISLVKNEFLSFLKKNADRTYRDVFKDIEISRANALTLLLSCFSVTILATLSVQYFSFIIELNEFLGGSGIMMGVVSGIFGGAVIIDKTKRRLFLIMVSNFIGFFSSIILFLFMERDLSEGISSLLGALLVFSIVFSGLLLQIMLIEFTTIMERGRVTSTVLVFGAISVALFYLLLTLPIAPIIPLFIPLLLALYFLKLSKKENEEAKRFSKTIDEEEITSVQTAEEPLNEPIIIPKIIQIGRFQIVLSNIKYYMIIALYGFICGLIIPIELVANFIFLERNLEAMILIAVISSIIIVIGGFLIGFVFDYFGKKVTLSVMIMIVSVANFLNIFTPDTSGEINMTAITSFAIFVFFVLTPLLLGDIGRTKTYGKITAFWITLGFGGLLGGYFFKVNLFYEFLRTLEFEFVEEIQEIVYYNYSVTSIVFMSCILLLFIISFMKEEVSIREYNWPNSLIKLYIIHESGILLHEYEFRESVEMVDSDLISGGIIGLVTMLKEITKDNNRLRTIDHGSKKLVFRWDSSGKAIFVLLVDYESLIVRQKLASLAKTFEETYRRLLEETEKRGIDTREWSAVKDLVEFYLTRKKFDFLGLKEIISMIESQNHENSENLSG